MTGHTSRVLHLAQSPDGTSVVSAAADETLRFWKCFGGDTATTTAASKAAKSIGTSSMSNAVMRSVNIR